MIKSQFECDAIKKYAFEPCRWMMNVYMLLYRNTMCRVIKALDSGQWKRVTIYSQTSGNTGTKSWVVTTHALWLVSQSSVEKIACSPPSHPTPAHPCIWRCSCPLQTGQLSAFEQPSSARSFVKQIGKWQLSFIVRVEAGFFFCGRNWP